MGLSERSGAGGFDVGDDLALNLAQNGQALRGSITEVTRDD